MNCVKCGRETVEEQVFCDICLAEMEDHPVKPGTAVYIPDRNVPQEVKKTRAKRKVVIPLSEQVLRLRKKVRRLRVAVALLLLICGGLCFGIVKVAGDIEIRPLLGQNYHTEETSAS